MGTKLLRLGITMRETDAVGYIEKRDSIAQEWPKYLRSALPDAQYLFIPNIGSLVIDFVKKWEINAFIFTGGEDVGKSSLRDLTESLLFNYSIQKDIPVLGICRGLQLIYSQIGGIIEQQKEDFIKIHKVTKHEIVMNGNIHTVNSYHQNKLVDSNLKKEITVLAICNVDKSIEAIKFEKMLGIMWHPEREKKNQDWETEIIKSHFYK